MAIINLTNTAVEKLQPSSTRREYRDSSLKGLLLRVYPSGKKIYVLNYARGKYINLGDAKVLKAAEARELARVELSKAFAGQDPQEARRVQRAGTFAEFYRNHYKAHIEEKQRGTRQALNRFKNLCNHFGKVPLTNITALEITKFQRRRKNAGISNTTINRDVSSIQAMLSYAVKKGFLAEHPFRGRIERYKEALNNPRYLSPEEETRLRDALQARDAESRKKREQANRWRQERNYKPLPEIGLYCDYLTPLILTALLTGLRRGELLNLTWKDINLAAGILEVRAEGAKSGKSRTLPFPAECLKALTEWKQLTAHSRPADYVFPNRNGARLDNINTAFRNLLKAAEITGFRFHDLRHHYASSLVQAGVQLYTVKELLGHSDFKMTQRYAHLAPDNLREAVRALDNRPAREHEQQSITKKTEGVA